MTFLPECGADSDIPTHLWIHNDRSMYVRFGGIRNTKTWSKSSEYIEKVYCSKHSLFSHMY